MPSLKSLYINLSEESQVDLIMRYLPVLEFLNGLPVDRDALDEDETEGAGDMEGQLEDHQQQQFD